MDCLLSSSSVVLVIKDTMALLWLNTPQSSQAKVRRALVTLSLKPDSEYTVATQPKAMDVQIVLSCQALTWQTCKHWHSEMWSV